MANEWQNTESQAATKQASEAASPHRARHRWVAITIPLGVAAVALLAGPPIIHAAQEAMTPRFETAAEACELVPLLVVADKGTTLTASVISGDSKLEPAYPPGYEDDPRSALAPGECLTGLMPFVDKGIVELRYENAYGDKAAWSVG